MNSVCIGADLLRGAAATYTGHVGRQAMPSGKLRLYHYTAGDLRFEVSRLGFMALAPELLYRVYYAPRSRVLLGIEPVRPGVRVAAGWLWVQEP